MNKIALTSLALLSCLTFSTATFALKSDRDQPAQIEADDTEVNFRTGVRTLTNNVLVVQGTLRLKADKLVATYNKQGDLTKAVADGSLARFKQRPDGKPDDVEGWAKNIYVDYASNTITLTGKAALKQGASTATGNKIVYNMETDKLRILGSSNVITEGKNGAKPKRRIEDPFKDDAPSPNVGKKPNSSNTKWKSNAKKASDEQEVDTPEVVPAPQVAPAKAGRSRLILQPRKKEPAKKEAKTEEPTSNDKDADREN